jgi:hypothetical protein
VPLIGYGGFVWLLFHSRPGRKQLTAATPAQAILKRTYFQESIAFL